jgi:hypothetical protein
VAWQATSGRVQYTPAGQGCSAFHMQSLVLFAGDTASDHSQCCSCSTGHARYADTCCSCSLAWLLPAPPAATSSIQQCLAAIVFRSQVPAAIPAALAAQPGCRLCQLLLMCSNSNASYSPVAVRQTYKRLHTHPVWRLLFDYTPECSVIYPHT